MRRREGEGKAANGLRCKPARGLTRDMGGMVVENDLDRGVGGVGGVEELEKLNEFAATVAFLDQGVDVTGEQIDTGHQGQGTVAFVLVITHHGGAGAGPTPNILIFRNLYTSTWAAACVSLKSGIFAGIGSQRIATLLIPGETSPRSSNRLPANSGVMGLKPVTLPPGRA